MDQSGSPEADEPGYPVRGDQDPARLQVAMDHRVLVGKMDRPTDLAEELQPRGDILAPIVAIRVDPPAVDVLHHQVSPAILGRPGVEEPGDIGVLAERRLDVALGAEPPHDRVTVHPAPDQLDGDVLAEVLDPDRPVDGPHAPAADPLRELIRPDPAPDHRVGLARYHGPRVPGRILIRPGTHGRGRDHRHRDRFHRDRLDHLDARHDTGFRRGRRRSVIRVIPRKLVIHRWSRPLRTAPRCRRSGPRSTDRSS